MLQETNNGLNSLERSKGTDISRCQQDEYAEMLPANMLEVLTVLTGTLKWDADYCLLPMVVAAAGAIGNAKITSIAGYQVYSILWGCGVGSPSVNKSEPLKFAVQPLRELFAARYATYQTEYAAWEQRPDKDKTPEPRLTETVFSDITIEKVAWNLQHNTKGAILAVDELKTWLNTFNRQSGSNAEQKYIELFNRTPLTDSRMSRKTVYVPAPYLSIMGTTQPDVIHRTFKDAANNGLKERILFVYPDCKPIAWNRQANREERQAAQKAWANIITPLYELQADQWPDGAAKPVYIPMDQAAKEILFSWQEENTKRKIIFPDKSAMLGKADIICPRLALILCLINNPKANQITGTDAVRAVNMMEYFLQHGQRVMKVIKEGEPGEPSPKQRLFAGLPDEFTTQEAIIMAAGLGISERTAKRYLNDKTFYRQKRQGVYEKA